MRVGLGVEGGESIPAFVVCGSSLNIEYLEASSCRKDVFHAGSRFARLVNFGEIRFLFSVGTSHSIIVED